MKKNHITFLLLLFILLLPGVPGFLMEGNPQEQEQKQKQEQEKAPSDCKITISININTPQEMMDENLQKQLNYFAKVAAIVNKKKQRNLFRPFRDQSKKKISHWLLKASEIEKDDCFKSYLKALSENILEKDRFSTDLPRWVDLEENRAEIVFADDERYLGFMLLLKSLFPFSPKGLNQGENSIYETIIYLNLPEDTRKFEEYTDLFARMQSNLPPQLKQEISYTPLIPSFKISHLVSSSQPSGFTLVYPDIIDDPVSGKPGEERSFKIIVFKNLAKAYFEEVLRPISGHVLTEERLWDVDYDSYISNIIMRRISHHLGPVFLLKEEGKEEKEEYEAGKYPGGKRVKKRKPKTKKKRKKVKELKTIGEILKDLFPIIEALKSQMIALHNTSVLINNGLIPEDKDINIYTTYLVSLIDQLRNSPEEIAIRKVGKSQWDKFLRNNKSENFLSALIQFNFLLKQEGIIFNINSRKIDIDRLKFQNAVEKLTEQVLRLLGNATYSAARKFIDRYILPPPQLKEILESIEQIPLDVEFHLKQEEVN